MRAISQQREPRDSAHLFTLPDGDWALWRWVSLRGTGFPAALPLKLAATKSAALADLVIRSESAVCEASKQALDEVNQSLDHLRQISPWDYRKKRAPLKKALALLSKGEMPTFLERTPALETLALAQDSLGLARAQLREAFRVERERISRVLREEVGRDQFCEAIIWQNRRAFHSGIRPLIDGGRIENRNSRLRILEGMAASYLQRYCLKNETIGFFGPVGWARLSSQSQGVVVRPGPGLLAERNLYFEVWCIDRLAKSLDKIEGIKWWTAPRLIPFVRVEGSALHLPFKGSIELSPEQGAILRACDGESTPKEIAARVSLNRTGKSSSEQEVYEFLELMESSGLIVWSLEIPMQLNPERALRRMIERIGDYGLRRAALESLDALEIARLDVEKARGNPRQLDEAIEKLETVFTRLTGEPPTRHEGKTYAARTLVFEDCRRDTEVEIGPEIIDSLAPALALLLTSARWLTFEAAQKCKTIFRQVYDRLAQGSGATHIDLLRFWELAQPLIFDSDKSPVAAAARSFQKRWSDILAIPPAQSRLHYDSRELRPQVLAAFDAPRPGWREAHYHAPDIMIAAPDEEAIRQGNFTPVMGELHVSFNTLIQALFVAQHPRPEELQRAIESDISEPLLRQVISKSNDYLMSARLMPALMGEKDYWVGFSSDPCGATEKNLLRPADLVVEAKADDIKVRSRDGRIEFDLLDVMAGDLMIAVTDQFKILPPANHLPRVTIDRLVISRESWSFSPAEMGFACEREEEERFIRARQWASSHGIPRFVFIKSPTETKPFYCDFDSPIYVDIFSKAVRKVSESLSADALINLTEMLPAHGEAWLPDVEGRRYASELRIVAVDLGEDAAI